MFLNFNTKKRTVDLHTAMWEISGIVYPHFYAGNENAPPALTGEGAGNGMTEAMPFLQKTILLSYDPRPFGGGFVVRTAVHQSAGASNTFLPAEYTARSAFGCRRYTARSSRWAGVRDFP